MHVPRVPLEIWLPLPPDSLRANRRLGTHWGRTNGIKRDYKAFCLLKLRSDRALAWDGPYPITLTATAYLAKGQRCDPSDLGTWLKPAIDVLVEARLLAGDDGAHINPFVARVERDRENPRVEIVIRET